MDFNTIVSQLSNVTYDYPSIETKTINDEKFYIYDLFFFKEEEYSLYASIITLLDEIFIFPIYKNKEQAVINFKHNIMNKCLKFIKVGINDIEMVLNINIIIDDVITLDFNPLKKSILLTKINNIYYPLIRVNDFKRVFDYGDDIIRFIFNSDKSIEQYKSNILDITNTYIYKSIYNTVVEKNINNYNEEFLNGKKVIELKEIANNLNIKCKTNLKKIEIIHLILENIK